MGKKQGKNSYLEKKQTEYFSKYTLCFPTHFNNSKSTQNPIYIWYQKIFKAWNKPILEKFKIITIVKNITVQGCATMYTPLIKNK